MRPFPAGSGPPLLSARHYGFRDTGCAPFTGAELVAAREYLGVSAEWLSGRLGVTARTLRNWESGRVAVPKSAADSVREHLDCTGDAEDELISWFRPSNRLRPAFQVFRTDAELLAACPTSYWPASWYRALYARVIRAGVATRIVHAGESWISRLGPNSVPHGGQHNPVTEDEYVRRLAANFVALADSDGPPVAITLRR